MSKTRGFSLIELLIAVVIIGILAAIAIPAYVDHIARGKIAQGVEALAEAKVRMEQVFNSQRTYKPGGNCPDMDPYFAETPFTVAHNPTCTDSTFTLSITGQAASGMSGYWYSINESGEKVSATPTASGATCWLMSKGQTSC